MADKAYITPNVLKWARESAKMTEETAAAKVSVTFDKFKEWEEGTSQPTIRQAQTLAKAYKRPFALFFLPEIPRDFHPLQDFRKSGSKALSTSSIFIIREIQQKQSWISDINEENNERKLPFVGKFSLKDNPEIVAKQNSLIIDPVKMQRLRDSMSIAQKEVSEQIALNGSNEKSIKDKIPHQEEYTNTDHPNLPKTNTQLSIGEQFAGGIIFYIDNTGKHGLVCAAYDQSKSISWYNGTFVSTNAKGAKIGTGKTNTNKIVKSQGSGNYAAGICQDLILNGYSDWYLPSIDELVLMYENLKVPGKSNFADAGYWSSSEIDKENAYEKGFGYGYTYSNGKYSEFCVRAIRSF